MIIHKAIKKEDGQIYLCTILTIRTQSVKVESVADDLIARGLCDLVDKVLGQVDIWIEDILAIDTNQMRMWMWVIAVVAVVTVAETQFQHLVHLFQNIQGFVDSRQARRRELVLDLVV